MKAVVWHAPGEIAVEQVPDARIQEPTDAVVRLTVSAICGTDLHMVRGSLPGMRPGTVLGHEGVGVVEEVGPEVRNFRPGDRVVIPSTLCCGTCSYCRAGYTAQCDRANPQGALAGTSFFGGPEMTGPVDGLQAEYARIPFAHVNLVALPEEVTDEQAIVVSDVYPTAWFGALLAEVSPGDDVAVFGCGPVGQLAITSAQQQGANRVLAVDHVASRLEMARSQHAETVDFDTEDPVETIRQLTGGIGVDRVIDAVGVDAEAPAWAAPEGFPEQRREITEPGVEGGDQLPPIAPSQASEWAVRAVAKAGTVGVVGVYPPTMDRWPIGTAMNRNLTVKLGNCNHRTHIPELLRMVRSGVVDPLASVTQLTDWDGVIRSYHTFDDKEPGWVKVAVAV
ncbi:alcohol dehydrogenase catalytic domain-containing protein [Actinoalloteichus spitiensis]|uniref:alcohol dehydrogenase catalytic domain-containing protein n=1 Tax=Actinoalloteichus spitiensis TaxID=252394 RepID=UPI0004751378|nr:alcohol dehydrogenase catalytic domain-containing protein [Actinoalloteichus spitiensis]